MFGPKRSTGPNVNFLVPKGKGVCVKSGNVGNNLKMLRKSENVGKHLKMLGKSENVGKDLRMLGKF